jgi:hypothetical protein
MAHLVQLVAPAELPNFPSGHALQMRADSPVGAARSKEPATHPAPALWHSRSLKGPGARDWYWLDAQSAECVWHMRCEVAVGAVVSYSSAAHTVSGAQTALASSLAALTKYSVALHTTVETQLVSPW